MTIRSHTPSSGFTLLELLIALAVFALVAAMAYGGLNAVLRGNERVEAQAERLKQLQLAFMWMQRDIEEALSRPIRDQFGDAAEPMKGSSFGTVLLEVTHAGWDNPLGLRRSSLQRVDYRVDEENRLLRRYWRVLDRAQDSEPVERVLLDGVKQIELRYWDAQGEHQQWPDTSSGQQSTGLDMPQAVEVRLETEREGLITRFFRVAG